MKRYLRWTIWQWVLEKKCKFTKHNPIRMNGSTWICDRCNRNCKQIIKKDIKKISIGDRIRLDYDIEDINRIVCEISEDTFTTEIDGVKETFRIDDEYEIIK